jgi:hypothetical protein
MALRNGLQAAMSGNVPLAALASLGSLPLAVGGGIAAHLVLGSVLPKIMPTTERIANISHNVAQFKQWGKAIETLDSFTGDKLAQWIRNPGAVIRGTRIVGENVLKELGENTDPTVAANNLQKRFAAINSSEQVMANYAQQGSAHIAGIAPQAAAAFGAVLQRHAMLAHITLQQLNESRPKLAFQPALSAKLPFSKDALSKAGRQLAAIYKPRETMQHILAGTAAPEVVQTFKLAHPEYFLATAKIMHMAIANHDKPLTSTHLMVAQKMGFRDGSTLSTAPSVLPQMPAQPGMASRQMRVGQAAYAQQGAQDAGPAMSRFQSLGKTLASGGADLNHNPVQQLKA